MIFHWDRKASRAGVVKQLPIAKFEAQHALSSTRYLTLNDDVPDTKEAIFIILDAKKLLTVLRFGLCWHQYRPCAKTK